MWLSRHRRVDPLPRGLCWQCECQPYCQYGPYLMRLSLRFGLRSRRELLRVLRLGLGEGGMGCLEFLRDAGTTYSRGN